MNYVYNIGYCRMQNGLTNFCYILRMSVILFSICSWYVNVASCIMYENVI